MNRKILKIICILLIIVVIIITLFFSKKKEVIESNITIIGDSRMVGLCSSDWYKASNGKCIAKIAMGYNWFIKTAIPEVDKLSENQKKYIVVNLGVNDLYNINKYISIYQELVNTNWKDSKIILLSINPTKGSYAHLNNDIDNFNKKMVKELGALSNVSYCDSNSYLKENGFESSDGLHYSKKTYKAIYEQIKKCIYDYYN